MAISHDSHKVLIQFGSLISWLGLPPKEARELATLLEHHANAIEVENR